MQIKKLLNVVIRLDKHSGDETVFISAEVGAPVLSAVCPVYVKEGYIPTCQQALKYSSLTISSHCLDKPELMFKKAFHVKGYVFYVNFRKL